MDLFAWAAVGAGCIIGLVTGLVPGLHVNTVCAVFLVALPTAGPTGAVALAAAGTAHAFASVLLATYLGSPSEETLASALPAHRMLHEGRGPDAVRLSLLATLAGLAGAVLVVLPYKWLLLQPVGLLDWVDRNMAAVLAALVVFLIAREAIAGARAGRTSDARAGRTSDGGSLRRGLRRGAGAAGILALSGLLGWLAMGWNVKSLFAVPATPLLPLLSGLFGAPALLESLRRSAPVPPQDAAPRSLGRIGPAIGSGIAASAATAILPGLTSSVAVALARAGQRGDDPRPVLATQAAISAAHLVLSFSVLWMSLRARTGLAVAVQTLQPSATWASGAPPGQVYGILQACLAAGVLAAAMTFAIDRWASRHVHRIPGRGLAVAALACVVILVVLLSGPMGLVLFLVATAVGLIPLATGLGRLHLTGALLLPVLALRLGFPPA